jgi:hypothetical protein
MRINLYAGAGCGKSTTASYVFSRLKQKNYKVELVHEYIKKWAYENKQPKSFDQVYIFGKQLNAEDSLLQSGVEHLVTDSPILMQVFYSKKYGFPCWRQLMEIAKAFELAHPSLNIFLDREGLTYQQAGRYESESEAKVVDEEMHVYLDEYVGSYKVFKSKDLDQIIEYIDEVLSGNSPVESNPGIMVKILRKFFT